MSLSQVSNINTGLVGYNSVGNPSSPTSTSSSLTPTSTSEEMIKKEDTSEPSSPNTEISGKKAGRRKIKIEFIDDKSRRHITFSKRKAGIMKKAYELSTLTGTQVLLLVASETGHVYTFATAKLQPLITRPEGKNLIQSCLNTPDNNPTSPSINNSHHHNIGHQQTQVPQQQVPQQQLQQHQQQVPQQTQQQQLQVQLQQQQLQQLQQQQQQQPQHGSPSQVNSRYNDQFLTPNGANSYVDNIYDIQDTKEIDRRLLGKDIKGTSTPPPQYLTQNMNGGIDINSMGYNTNYNPMGYYQPQIQTRYLQSNSASSSPASPNQFNYPHSLPINNFPNC